MRITICCYNNYICCERFQLWINWFLSHANLHNQYYQQHVNRYKCYKIYNIIKRFSPTYRKNLLFNPISKIQNYFSSLLLMHIIESIFIYDKSEMGLSTFLSNWVLPTRVSFHCNGITTINNITHNHTSFNAHAMTYI